MKRSIPANKRSSREMFINAKDFHISFTAELATPFITKDFTVLSTKKIENV